MATQGLLDLARSLHHAATLAAAMDMALAAVSAATRYRRAWLGVPLPDGAGLEIVGYALPDHQLVAQRMATVDIARDAYLTHALTASEPFVIEDLRLDPRADQAQVAFFGNRTIINVPMVRLGGERFGAFTVGTFAAEGVLPPTPAEFDAIVQIASLVSAAAARIRAEDEGRILAEHLRAAQRLEGLGRLSGEIAHDFNNLLTAISGNAELAKAASDPAQAHDALDEILGAARRAAALTRQLLAFSRNQPRQPRPLDLDGLIAQFRPLLARLLPAGVVLEVHLDAGATVVADPGQLEQVVMNLVVNARDALAGPGHIAVATALVPPSAVLAAPHVALTVADSGPGIADDVRARLFEPFFTTKRAGAGTGLGLAVVDNIVRQHHGQVRVANRPDGGAEFTVLLPVAPEAVVAAAPPPTDASPVAPPRAAAHVLVVDDDPTVRGLVSRILTGAGYQVSAVADAEAALALPTLAAITVVVSDLVLPGLDGLGLARRLAATSPSPPVLLMSGYAPDGVDTRGTHLLAKPFTRASLLAKLDELVRAT